MALKNRYYRVSKLQEKTFRQIVRCFALDMTATMTSELTGISLRRVNDIYLKIRRRLAELSEQQAQLCGVIEIDESYFGPRRVRGKRGRGAARKTVVFGISQARR